MRCLILSVGRLDFNFLRIYLQLKFYIKCLSSDNTMLSNIAILNCCSTEFKHLCEKAGLEHSDYASFRLLSIGKLKAAVHASYGATCVTS